MPQNNSMQKHNPSRIVRDDESLILTVTRQGDARVPSRLDPGLVQSLLAEQTSRRWKLLNYHLLREALVSEERPAGAIVTFLPSDPEAEEVQAIGCPIVRVGRLPHPGDAAMPCVIPDFSAAATMAVKYLAGRGFRDLAMIGHRSSDITSIVETGLREVSEEAGCRFHPHHFANFPTHIAGTDRFAQRSAKLMAYLAELPKPVALLAFTSSIASMVSVMCRQAGLGVPEDVAILALDDSAENCQMGPVALSAVDLNAFDLGTAAADVLGRMIAGKPVPEVTRVPPRGIITRRSTDILAVNDPIVARAVRFIWDQLANDLSVDQVADAVETPRYKLERLFRQYLDRGVYEEVRRARLERFCDLLKNTDETIGNLAPLVGYRSVNRLHHAFQKEFNTTPRHYRLDARGETDNGDE